MSFKTTAEQIRQSIEDYQVDVPASATLLSKDVQELSEKWKAHGITILVDEKHHIQSVLVEDETIYHLFFADYCIRLGKRYALQQAMQLAIKLEEEENQE